MLRFSSLCLLTTVVPCLTVSAQDVVLAGWHDFSQGYQAFRTSGSPKAAVSDLNGVSGSLYGGDGARVVSWGSSDGTYGPSQAVGSSEADGSISIRVDKPTIDFSITNTTGSNLSLGSIVFDFASVNGNSPRNLQVLYTGGGLTIPDATVLLSLTDIHNSLPINSDYEDVSIDLTTLADHSLAPGQTANFQFLVDTANVNNQALGLDNIAILGSSPDFRIVTYNIHGGKGPSGEGDLVSNLTAFRDNFLQGEDVLCFQEVDDGDEWTTLKGLFPDYPHTYLTTNTTTAPIWPWQTRGTSSCAVLSKHPFVSTHNQLIQTDPAVDEWERHAQHVQIEVGTALINIFHFHNTYNFGYQTGNTPWSEREGLEKFRDYVEDRLDVRTYAAAENLIMLGDYNLFQNGTHQDVEPILLTTTRQTNNRDHITATPQKLTGGNYLTVTPDLSDHNAVWASFDLAPPTSDPAIWATPPSTVDENSITMTAAVADDPSGVEYYFANTTIPDQSHDSGWQSSPTYTDTELRSATAYSYTVRTRDLSANLNEGLVSAASDALTSDGDSLPDDWELTYFSTLSASRGLATEDWDGDGLSDIDEWTAGTDPTDPESLLTAWLTTDSPDTLRIHWSSVAGKVYRVASSLSLLGTWTPLSSDIEAESTESSHQFSVPTDAARFYRIEVGF